MPLRQEEVLDRGARWPLPSLASGLCRPLASPRPQHAPRQRPTTQRLLRPASSPAPVLPTWVGRWQGLKSSWQCQKCVPSTAPASLPTTRSRPSRLLLAGPAGLSGPSPPAPLPDGAGRGVAALCRPWWAQRRPGRGHLAGAGESGAVPSRCVGRRAFRGLPLSAYWVPVLGLTLAPCRDTAHCHLIQGCPGPRGQNYVPTDEVPLPEQLISGGHRAWEGEEPSLGVLRESGRASQRK